MKTSQLSTIIFVIMLCFSVTLQSKMNSFLKTQCLTTEDCDALTVPSECCSGYVCRNKMDRTKESNPAKCFQDYSKTSSG